MDVHRRWLCRECKREWLEPKECFVNSQPCSITGNPPGDNCPVCGSPEIQEVLFKPYMPGLDIPRDGEFTVLPRKQTIAVIPGRVSTEDIKIQVPPGSFAAKPQEVIQQDSELDALALLKSTQQAQPISVEESRSSIYDLSDMD